MKTIKTKIGEVRFQDCIEGMKSLKDKSFDLCLTDPPFNVGFKGVRSRQTGNDDHGQVIYTDNNPEYLDFCKSFYKEVMRICHRAAIFPGNSNIVSWLEFCKPELKDIGVWYIKNGNGMGTAYWFRQHEFILLLGDWGKNRLSGSVFEVPVFSGFLRDTGENEGLIHSCPRPPELYRRMIKQCKAKSVLDPFLGSGTTACACESLGVPYLGFEMEELYEPDINLRINAGIARREKKIGKQKNVI
jgi:site-specific DNA-methyltransferase (adenine-specific)